MEFSPVRTSYRQNPTSHSLAPQSVLCRCMVSELERPREYFIPTECATTSSTFFVSIFDQMGIRCVTIAVAKPLLADRAFPSPTGFTQRLFASGTFLDSGSYQASMADLSLHLLSSLGFDRKVRHCYNTWINKLQR